MSYLKCSAKTKIFALLLKSSSIITSSLGVNPKLNHLYSFSFAQLTQLNRMYCTIFSSQSVVYLTLETKASYLVLESKRYA